MELIMPQNIMDFDFHSTRTSPHASPPLTPRRFGESYFSAPASPSRASEFYREFDAFCGGKDQRGAADDFVEFDFHFCGNLQMDPVSSADDLFDNGRIRNFKPPMKLEIVEPGSNHNSDLSTVVVVEEQEQGDQPTHDIAKSIASSSSVFRKWKLKDFLLFRSASEGRASNKYPVKKLAALTKGQGDGKSSSFRSIDSLGSQKGSRRSKPQLSAHELLYTKNKAASESLKKKTYLPYKQGILGRLF